MQVVVQDLLTNYQMIGKGKLVVLLHGWASSLATFHEVMNSLANDYQVVVLDLPGFGQTQAPPAGWTLDDYAKFVAAFMRKVTKTSVYGLVAHSNGGALAIRGLAEHSLKADKLVLIASAGIRGRQKAKRLAVKVVAKTGKVLTRPLPLTVRQSLRNRLYGVAGSDMLIAPHMQETFKKTVGQDIQADARKVKTPTLLLYGSEDRATPPDYGERLASLLPHAQLELIDGASHFVHSDQPAQVLRLIREFLG